MSRATSKKLTRRLKARRFRLAFKRGVDCGDRITGRRIARHRYGDGIGRAHLRTLNCHEMSA